MYSDVIRVADDSITPTGPTLSDAPTPELMRDSSRTPRCRLVRMAANSPSWQQFGVPRDEEERSVHVA